MRHELLVAVEDGDVEVGVGVADEAPAKQVLQSKNRLTNKLVKSWLVCIRCV